MKKLKLMNAIFLETSTEAETEQRALEILQVVEPILESQKHYWSKQIKILFEEFINSDEDPVEMMNRKKGGLYWAFHKRVFLAMCAGYKDPLPASPRGGE